MAAPVSDTDAYYKVYIGLHLFTYESIASIDNALKVWHTNHQQILPPCKRQCPDGKKPKLPTSCQRCVDWGSAVEAALFHPPGAPSKPQLTWQNINQSNLGKSHVEAAKAFVLRLPQSKGYPGSTRCNSISHFDSASILMVMTRFHGFHGGDQASYDKIMKVAEIRNELSHLGLQKNMLFDDQKVKQYFQVLQEATKYVENLHPHHFTSGPDVRAKLHAIQMETVTNMMKEEMHLQLQGELAHLKEAINKQDILKQEIQQHIRDEVANLTEVVRNRDNEKDDMQQLIRDDVANIKEAVNKYSKAIGM